MPQIERKFKELVMKLHARTQQGEIPWETTAGPDTFQVAFPDYSVSLSLDEDGWKVTYVLSIRNDQGNIIEVIRSDMEGEISDEYGLQKAMKELYEQARRQALGVEKAIDDLLGHLGAP
ncbi:MAG: hypothetical protein FJ118_06690 [Deltaproteobacteria bacterium]|nr:hypothetical protein [Deltaproteobacteria bacterium]